MLEEAGQLQHFLRQCHFYIRQIQRNAHIFAGCDVVRSGASHLPGDIEGRCARWHRSWDIMAAPATKSTSSNIGNYGGVIAASQKHLSTQPICGDVRQGERRCLQSEILQAERFIFMARMCR